MVAVIKKLWDVTWDLWEQHNGFLHDRDYQETLHNMASIDTEIRLQCRQGHAHLPRQMWYLFDGRIEDLLTMSVHNRKQWLASITAASWAMATEHLAQQDQGMAASRQLMHAWLDGHSAGEG
jgi:hypothetical protein